MKHFKLIVLMCLVVLMALTAVACGGTETPGTTATTTPAADVITTPTATDETTPAATTPVETTPAVTTPVVTTPDTTLGPVPTSFASMKIGETPISDYTIVYATSPYEAYAKDNSKKQYFPVYDFDHETANRLADLIFDLTGVRLNVVQDTKSTEVANEILIGKTNRSVSSSGHFAGLFKDDYVVNVVGSKLVIRGGEFGTTWHAIDYLETRFAAKLAKREVDYTFASGFLYKGKHHITVIGCIGDSITQGVGASDQALLSYPAQMGRLLWKDAIVQNYGNSGSTMRDDLGDAYTKRNSFMYAVGAAANADIFTIMLGTNDSNRDQAWSDADSQSYNESCLGIMKALKAKNPDLKFVLANCPAYFGSANFGSLQVLLLQKALVSTANDAGYPTTFFDTYTATKTLRSYFPDSLHPNDMGHLKMAEAFAEYLQTLITPATNEAK
ncbi:MAG: SGNH/GDSL hydrolase family protein [Clostridia bacterium]|nr:SGNH/GDSL hydrolase family protein [Clostridia bacterium]